MASSDTQIADSKGKVQHKKKRKETKTNKLNKKQNEIR